MDPPYVGDRHEMGGETESLPLGRPPEGGVGAELPPLVLEVPSLGHRSL